MEKKYYITQDQFESIQHYKRMFESHADRVKDLCNTERADVVYGFELGQIYSHQRDCFIEMMDLESDIKNQKLEEIDLVATPNLSKGIKAIESLEEINKIVDDPKYPKESNEYKIWEIINNTYK